MNIFLMGGWIMWPLALVSVTVTAIVTERILLLSSCPFPSKDFTGRLEQAVEGDIAPLLEALRKVSMLHRFADIMERKHPGKETALRIEGEAVIKNWKNTFPCCPFWPGSHRSWAFWGRFWA